MCDWDLEWEWEGVSLRGEGGLSEGPGRRSPARTLITMVWWEAEYDLYQR